MGVRDNPPIDSKIRDHRVKQFIEEYYSPVDNGAERILGQKLDHRDIREVTNWIKELQSEHVYISIDIDVGPLDILSSRFKPNRGLSEPNLMFLLKTIKKWLEKCGIKICGIDVMEIDTFEANGFVPGRENRTCGTCASLIKLPDFQRF